MLTKYRRADHGMTTSHFMCGAGGETLGFALAGFDPYFNTNHNQRVIDTIEENFPNTRTKVADVSNLNFRALPRTVGGTGSPICTELAPSGGRARKNRQKLNAAWNPDQGQLVDQEPVDEGLWERTRLTAYCTLRAAEVCDYDFFFCENVVEFATDWPLFTWWLQGWDKLGYNVTTACVSSAHIATDDVGAVPQWRDRWYAAFTKKGMPIPDLAPRPIAPCVCGADVEAVQWWKNPDESRIGPHPIGKYKQQYLYRSPHGGTCKRAIVEPYVPGATEIIDWSELGPMVRERVNRPLVANTRARIQKALDEWGGKEPFVTILRNNQSASRIGDPLTTVVADGNHRWLTTPAGIVFPYRKGNLSTTTETPLPTISTKDSVALVIPHRRDDRVSTTDDPRPTLLTRDFARLTSLAPTVDDCRYRMFKSRENLRAQGFPDWYTVVGNGTVQNLAAGNAVSVNVAYWAAQRIYAALDSRSAA